MQREIADRRVAAEVTGYSATDGRLAERLSFPGGTADWTATFFGRWRGRLDFIDAVVIILFLENTFGI